MPVINTCALKLCSLFRWAEQQKFYGYTSVKKQIAGCNFLKVDQKKLESKLNQKVTKVS